MAIFDSYIPAADTDILLGLGFTGGATKGIGQAFTASFSGNLLTAEFRIRSAEGSAEASGTGNAILVASVYASSGTLGTNMIPTGSPLGESQPIPLGSVSPTLSWVAFTFAKNPVALTSGTNYVVGLRLLEGTTGGVDWVRSTTDDGNGSFYTTDPLTWSSTASDYSFKVSSDAVYGNVITSTLRPSAFAPGFAR